MKQKIKQISKQGPIVTDIDTKSSSDLKCIDCIICNVNSIIEF